MIEFNGTPLLVVAARFSLRPPNPGMYWFNASEYRILDAL